MSQDRITEILNKLKNIKGVHGAAIIEKFGLIKGRALPGWIDEESVAAMVTLILKASQRASKELEQGTFDGAIVESQKGRILFDNIKDNIIVVISGIDAKLGIVKLKLNAAVKALTPLL
ncbi:MAG: roadblock/LC7 domain-containing protein [Candidatus Lokiarchaeota archaeon]|nr:roadblock/LC7 domain-containing protein [Candidatus Lokiarchaeota archaeon]